MVFRCLVGRVLGVVLVMLVARAWACGRVVVRCWGSETAQAWGKQAEGRKLTNGLRPSHRVRPRVYPRTLSVVYLCGSRMVVWVAAASPLTIVSPRVMVRPWCAVRPL